MDSAFKLVNSISNEFDKNCFVPVEKYISTNTGMHLYVCKVNGPVVEGYFSLATEAFDDDGLPHTLEHMIFLGSEDYPYSGVLDLLANKVYAAGTNAWTAVDNTTYTISTAEKCGFLQLLPIYLDHIFFPMLNESGFITEVYHVNGEGEDAGVVYSEMQSVENEDENIVERALHRALYPDLNCGYRYETGGIMHNLRTSTSHKKVCDYHAKMYRPENMAVIIAGQIEASEIISVLDKFEKKILAKNLKTLKLNERPFSTPITTLAQDIQETVYFPCDEEKSCNGLVSIAWRGPHISNLRLIVALDLLLYYLTDSSISPLESHFVNKQSYCSKISYKVEEYRETHLCITFENTIVDHLSKIKEELFTLLGDLVAQKVPFDLDRMQSIIKMKICETIDRFEDSPHETVSHLCIGDFLYGSSTDSNDFKRKFTQINTFESIKTETSQFWLKLIEDFLFKAFSVTIIGKPCEKLMHSIGEEDKRRVEERRKALGKKGLKDLRTKVDNAVSENDDFEMPDEIYGRLQVPSLENLELRSIKQFFSGSSKQNCDFEPFTRSLNDFQLLNHLQVQVDHLKDTNFIQAYVIIDTTKLSSELRPYLQLFTNLLFELPVKNHVINLTHEQVVYELNKDLLEFDASIGINGSEFEPGIFPRYLSVFTKTSVNEFESALKWLKFIVFDTIFDCKQIQIVTANLLKNIKKRKLQPSDLILSVATDLYFHQDSNLCLNNFLRQEKFLSQILEDLSNKPGQVEAKLNELRDTLLHSNHLRFYICADLSKVNSIEQSSLEDILLKYFPPSLEHREKAVFNSIIPQFKVEFTWNMKKCSSSSARKVFTNSPKKDYIINLGATESAFLKAMSNTDINSYDHPDYAGLLVLIEYFCQTEGPLWEAVRGPGYAYHQSMYLNPEKALIHLSLDECSNVTKAYESTRKILKDHLSNRTEFDENLLESAKNSLIFLLIDDLKSVSNYSAYSMSCIFKGVKIDAIAELIKKIEKVELSELRNLLSAYLMPLFSDETSNCLIVCHPAKSDAIIEEFSQK